MNGESRVWIVISRPDRLPTAIAVAQAVRAQFPGGVHLLHEHSKWWEHAQWRPYAGQFDETHAFPRVNTCRGLRDLSDSTVNPPRGAKQSRSYRSVKNAISLFAWVEF